MEFDDDPFFGTEKPAVKPGARAGGRFQPRAKAQLRKETSSSVPSSIPVKTKEKAVTLSTTQSAQPANIVDNNPTNPAIVGTKEFLKNNEESLSGVPNKQSEAVNPSSPLASTKEDSTSSDAPPPEASVSGSTKEADPSGFDLDPFSDVILEPATTRAGGKYRPKAKPKLREKTSAPKEQSSTLPSADSDTTQSVQPVDIAENKLTGPVGPSLAISEFVGTKKPPEDNQGSFLDDSRSVELAMPSSQLVVTRKDVGSKDALHVEAAKSNKNGDLPSVIGKSEAEVNSMELNLDSLDDILCQPGTGSALAGGRFQPKAKSRPTVETSAAVSSALPNFTIEKTVTSDPALSVGCRDSHSGFGNSVGENADIFSGLECLDDTLTQSTGGTVGAAIRSKVEMDAEPGNKLPTSYVVNNDGECLLSSSETPVPFNPSNKDTEENGGSPAQTSVDSTFRVSDATEAHTCPDNSMTQDPVDDGSTLIDSGRVETEDAEAFHDFETLNIMPEGAVASGRRARKFQPKPKVQTGKEKPTTSISHPEAANSQFIPSETECMDEGSMPAFLPDDVFDYSSKNLGDITPPDPTASELPVNEEVTNLAETSQPDVAVSGHDVHSEDVPGMPEKVSSKGRKRKTSLAKSKKASTTGEVNEGGKSLRQLRKRVAARELVDDTADEADDNGGSPAGPSSNSATDEGKDDDDDDYIAESPSRKKRAPRKSKKPVAENEKPVQKRKRTKGPLDQSTQEPPKKFSRSTRRNKRCVDKVLLQTPEDDLNFQRLPIKDIILLAEYKERIAKKEAKTSTPPLTNQSTENSFHEEESFREEESHSEDERFASEQFGGSTDNQEIYKAQSSSLYFNYQTYMNKAPSSRWSKQDTELFYEAVQQFGTDFSMIQQLFPGRTRHQVKLKYKKEQRQHPLRLSEAETNRAKDHSHFEKVIEQLQQAAAQAEQDVNGHEVDEMTTQTNEDATKSGLDEDATVKESEADVAEVRSHLKSDESDDDLDDIFDSYKSEY